jgi:hypothetical protein
VRADKIVLSLLRSLAPSLGPVTMHSPPRTSPLPSPSRIFSQAHGNPHPGPLPLHSPRLAAHFIPLTSPHIRPSLLLSSSQARGTQTLAPRGTSTVRPGTQAVKVAPKESAGEKPASFNPFAGLFGGAK